MEGGASTRSCMMEFGDSSTSGGISSMVMMMPQLMNSGSSTTAGTSNNKMFFPSCFSNNSSQNQRSSNGSQRVAAFMPQDNISNHNAAAGFIDRNNTINLDANSSSSMRAKIMAHPHFPRLLAAYVNCQKVGAPAEVVARLEEACGPDQAAAMVRSATVCIGEDPALDQFMEAYCEMLTKYEQELTKPFKDAMLFLSRIESQFNALTVNASTNSGRSGSSEEEVDANGTFIDPQAEDRELKGQLLRKYSGYLGNLKQEFLKKKKKGKLPKEARQQLLEWWNRHYKWPYPSESQKLVLAESTGLDQKQINNWFINQRKRHWKPAEDMQFVVMDAAYPPHYYMDNVMGNPFPMDFAPTHL